MYLMFKYATTQDQYKIFSAVLLGGASSVLCSCLSGRNVLLFHFNAMSMAHEGVILNATAKMQIISLHNLCKEVSVDNTRTMETVDNLTLSTVFKNTTM